MVRVNGERQRLLGILKLAMKSFNLSRMVNRGRVAIGCKLSLGIAAERDRRASEHGSQRCRGMRISGKGRGAR